MKTAIVELRATLRAEKDTARACEILLAAYRTAAEADRATLRHWLESLACRGFASAGIVMRYRKRMGA